MKGIIFDIQYGAMYDGPGLRTLVFFKGCPLKCEWCQNPESQLPQPQMSYFSEKCASCGECADACKQGALKMKKELPIRNTEKCAVCGECADACPNGAMEKIGMEMSPEEIAKKVLRDRPFYESSGGGVTISGGEPTMQPEFLIETLKEIKRNEIQIAVETCGLFKTDLVDELIDVVDLFLFDLKHLDSNHHKEFTGVENDTIKRNFEEILAKAGAERIVPRIPLIPGFNVENGTADEISAYLKSIGYSGEVHLMPYNPMARSKWEKIGRGDEYENPGELSEEAIEEITECFEKASFKVVCNR